MEVNTNRMISLDGENYLMWKAKMEDLLYCKDLAAPIENHGTKPMKIDEEDWKVLDRKVVGFIRQWVEPSVFHHVSTETSAFSLWRKLEELYDQKTAAKKAYLFRKLGKLQYKEGTSIAQHLNEMKSLVNQLSAMKLVLDDELQALLLLNSLPDSWETLVVSLSNSAPDGIMRMNHVTGSLLNEETRRKSSSDESHSEALVTERRGRGKSRKPHNRDKSRGDQNQRKKLDVLVVEKWVITRVIAGNQRRKIKRMMKNKIMLRQLPQVMTLSYSQVVKRLA